MLENCVEDWKLVLSSEAVYMKRMFTSDVGVGEKKGKTRGTKPIRVQRIGSFTNKSSNFI